MNIETSNYALFGNSFSTFSNRLGTSFTKPIGSCLKSRFFEFTSKNLQLFYIPQNILLEADKSRVGGVISNLLNNAIKFTPEGNIIISVEKDKISNNKDFIIVSVKDTGEGIDSSILPRLFTKFASKSHEGTGLGLFISKGVVEAHGGKMWGKNNVDGKGATFSFSLPIEENQ